MIAIITTTKKTVPTATLCHQCPKKNLEDPVSITAKGETATRKKANFPFDFSTTTTLQLSKRITHATIAIVV